MDHSDGEQDIWACDFIAQSTGGLIARLGEPAMHQVSLAAPAGALTPEEATTILTSLRRERCALLSTVFGESVLQQAGVLPLFPGGDPLGKTPPTDERLPADITGVLNPFLSYSDAQLAYIVAYDQETAESFIAHVRESIPVDSNAIVALAEAANPFSANDDAGAAARDAALDGC